jgi:hypothetical protein
MKHIPFPGRLAVLFLLVSVLLPMGCGKSGPDSVNRTSAGLASLKERVDFLERHVTFRRTYESLDFAIYDYNGGEGMLPSPSEYNIRLVAMVPAAELAAWIPAGSPVAAADTDWLKAVPTSVELSGINEWYVDGRKIVGVDRERRIVAYRIWKD